MSVGHGCPVRKLWRFIDSMPWRQAKYPVPDRPFGRPGGHAVMRPRRGLRKLLRIASGPALPLRLPQRHWSQVVVAARPVSWSKSLEGSPNSNQVWVYDSETGPPAWARGLPVTLSPGVCRAVIAGSCCQWAAAEMRVRLRKVVDCEKWSKQLQLLEWFLCFGSSRAPRAGHSGRRQPENFKYKMSPIGLRYRADTIHAAESCEC